MNKDKRFPTKTSLVLYFMNHSKRWFGLAIFFAALVSMLDLINPKIIAYAVDAVLGSETVELPTVLQGMFPFFARILAISHLPL